MSEATPRTIYRVAPGPLRFVNGSWDAEGAGRRPSRALNCVNFHFPNYELVPAMQEASRQFVCNNSGRSLF